MKAIVDDELCIGCGLCEDLCPDVFKQVEGLAVVQVDPVPPESEDCARQSADDCPTVAIRIEE